MLYSSSLSFRDQKGSSQLQSQKSVKYSMNCCSRASHILYIFLKGQETVLRSIDEKIKKSPESVCENHEYLEIMGNTLEKLLNSNYSNLFTSINEAINIIQSLLSKSENHTAKQLLLSAVSMNRMLKICSYDNEKKADDLPLQKPGNNNINDINKSPKRERKISPPEINTTFPNNNNTNTNNNSNIEQDYIIPSSPSKEFRDQDDDDFVICRICEQKINIDKIEEHTKICANMYRSAAFVNEVNEKLKVLLKGLKSKYLEVNWPGKYNSSVSIYIPILNVTTAIENVINIEPGDPDSTEELRIYSNQFSFSKSPSSIEFELMKFKPLISSKYKASIALTKMNDQIGIQANSLFSEKNEPTSPQHETRPHATFPSFIQQSISVPHTLPQNSHRNLTPNHKRRLSFNVYKQTLISDFEFVKRISRGAFARVFLAKKKSTKDIFAIKVTPKSSLKEKNQVKRVLAEKDILLQFSNPHIVTFYYSIIGKNNLYLVMEYLPGGDLYSLLQNIGSMDEDTAKVYSYQILQALKYLREKGIIHRDLKPDNILIAKNGDIKLTDFGLSYIGIMNRSSSNDGFIGNSNSNDNIVQSSSLVGTPDYIAPEIILNRPHSFSADLWSLGVMIFEFVYGFPPFHGKTEKDTHAKIISGRFAFPKVEDEDDIVISDELKDLITKLLVLNPDERIGASNIDELLNHPWFRGVENMEVPFTPELKSRIDTNYFECRYDLSCNKDDKDILEDMMDTTLPNPPQPSLVNSIPVPNKINQHSSFGSLNTSNLFGDPLNHHNQDNISEHGDLQSNDSLSSLSNCSSCSSSSSFSPISGCEIANSCPSSPLVNFDDRYKTNFPSSNLKETNNESFGGINSSGLEVKFESVSIQSLMISNRRMAEKVRRRRSLSFDTNKQNKDGKTYVPLFSSPSAASNESSSRLVEMIPIASSAPSNNDLQFH